MTDERREDLARDRADKLMAELLKTTSDLMAAKEAAARLTASWRRSRRDRGGAGYAADTLLPAALVRREVGRFIVRDHGGQALAYVYFEEEPGGARRLTYDEAPRIAANSQRPSPARRGPSAAKGYPLS